jgi:ABC-type multidrug transport system fused ATPase/permease subunit
LLEKRSPERSWLPNELRWLSKQIRPFLHLHLISFLCITAGSLLGLLTPLVLKWLIDQIIPQRRASLLLLSVALLFVGYQGRTALTSLGSYLTLTAAQRMGLSLRMFLLRHLDTLSAEYYEDTPVGKVMYPLKEPIDEISYFGSDLLPAILRSILTMCFTLATMLVLSRPLTLAVFPLVPAFLIVRQRFRQRLTVDSDIAQNERRTWNQFLEEHLCSVIPIQLLCQQRRQERRAFQVLARSVRSQQSLFKSSAWFTVASSLAVVLSTCTVIGFGGMKVLAGTLSVGSLVAFYSFIAQLFEPLSGAAELYARAQKTFASIRQVQAALALSATIRDASVTIRLSQKHAAQVDLTDVEFGYRRRKDMLHIPALRILAGEKVGIVGDNGAGKSALAKLLARFYDVDSGRICIGGEDIRGIQLESLRRHVCYLPREPALFDGTLASNLHFVKPTASDRELQDVIRAVGLSVPVATFPDGLRQRTGPGGCQLSGGQRQRLALARAVFQQPRILILDEATSCLDAHSERLILGNIKRFLPTATLVVISHRLSTLSALDRVLLFRNGRVIEDGNPRSLKFRRSMYSQLFASTNRTEVVTPRSKTDADAMTG